MNPSMHWLMFNIITLRAFSVVRNWMNAGLSTGPSPIPYVCSMIPRRFGPAAICCMVLKLQPGVMVATNTSMDGSYKWGRTGACGAGAMADADAFKIGNCAYPNAPKFGKFGHANAFNLLELIFLHRFPRMI